MGLSSPSQSSAFNSRHGHQPAPAPSLLILTRMSAVEGAVALGLLAHLALLAMADRLFLRLSFPGRDSSVFSTNLSTEGSSWSCFSLLFRALCRLLRAFLSSLLLVSAFFFSRFRSRTLRRSEATSSSRREFSDRSASRKSTTKRDLHSLEGSPRRTLRPSTASSPSGPSSSSPHAPTPPHQP